MNYNDEKRKLADAFNAGKINRVTYNNRMNSLTATYNKQTAQSQKKADFYNNYYNPNNVAKRTAAQATEAKPKNIANNERRANLNKALNTLNDNAIQAASNAANNTAAQMQNAGMGANNYVDPSGASAGMRERGKEFQQQAAREQQYGQQQGQIANRNPLSEASTLSAAQSADKQSLALAASDAGRSAGDTGLLRNQNLVMSDPTFTINRSDTSRQRAQETSRQQNLAQRNATASFANADVNDYNYGQTRQRNLMSEYIGNAQNNAGDNTEDTAEKGTTAQNTTAANTTNSTTNNTSAQNTTATQNTAEDALTQYTYADIQNAINIIDGSTVVHPGGDNANKLVDMVNSGIITREDLINSITEKRKQTGNGDSIMTGDEVSMLNENVTGPLQDMYNRGAQ